MPHKLKLRGRIWHFSGTVAGERFRGTTGTTDKSLAQRIAAEEEARRWKCHTDGPQSVLTMAQAMTSYLDSGKSERYLLPIAKFWKETKVRDISEEAIRQSARKLYPDASPATWNRQVIVPTQAVINHAAAMRWCSKISVPRFPVDPKKKKPAKLEWVFAFADQAVADGLPHLAALCLFMFATGARVGQSCNLLWKDVSLSNGQAKLFTAKPEPWTRIAHLPPEVVAAIANIPSNRQDDAPVFKYAGPGSLKTAWANVVTRAGIEARSPHCCRHGFATSMLHKGFDVVTVAKRGGWKDPAVVLRTYGHELEDPSVTNSLFDTNLAQASKPLPATISKKRRKR